MNIWIVTTGSSDVQLKTDEYWDDWYRDIKSECYNLRFKPTQNIPEADDSYRIAPRVLGMAYKAFSEEVWENLEFPLLKEFTNKLQDKSIDRIFLLLTDQMTEKSQVFDEDDLDTLKHPHWQDTYQLEPILCRYLNQKFPDTPCEVVLLDPLESGKGLDNWDAVLDLVSRKFKDLDIEVSEGEYAYVSHQAGTPALSSAVQFCSLATFSDRVRFLVSNEYNSELTDFVPSSSYLLGIKREQAKELLKNYDYAGVDKIVGQYLSGDNKILLNAAIQWNYAKFDYFVDQLEQLSDQKFEKLVEIIKDRRQYYWWTAYEAAYLAAIRHSQENMVEALFHSFRAIEGLICEWAIAKYNIYVYYDKKGSPQISENVKTVLPDYWEKVAQKNQSWLNNLADENRNREGKGKMPNPVGVGLFSQNLYLLLEEVKPELKKDSYLKKGLYSAKETRNQQFHRLLGLQEEDLKKAWDVTSIPEWQETVIGCLNAIAKDDLPNDLSFRLPKDASLMAQVHRELTQAIASL